MRHTILLVMVALLMVVAAAGVALAVTKTCTTVPCKGTSAADVLRERIGDGKPDAIYGGGGRDRLWAWAYGGDTDRLYGGRGKDRLDVLDGDLKDLAHGGPGKHDVCLVDEFKEADRTCDIVGIT